MTSQVQDNATENPGSTQESEPPLALLELKELTKSFPNRFIDWARYAELFDFGPETDQFFLPETAEIA